MNDETRERIEKDAKAHSDNYTTSEQYNEGMFDGYVDGATAEHSRITELLKEERNKAIDECLKVLIKHNNLIDVSTDFFKAQFGMLKQ